MTKRPKAKKTASLVHERHFRRVGCQSLFGLDEAGRGALAGPVVAAAVALPLERQDLQKILRGARDSKEMRPGERAELGAIIKSIAAAWGIGACSAADIDAVGIVSATKRAMLDALAAAGRGGRQPDCLLLDYMLLPERRDLPQVSIVEGDKHSLSIACASILAKTARDAQLVALDRQYPEYGFAQHKGYGTAAHLRALEQHGPCAEHRRSFKPVAAALREASEEVG